MNLKMESERREHGDHLVQLDSLLTVLERVNKSLGYAGKVGQLALAQIQPSPAKAKSVRERVVARRSWCRA